MGAVLLDDAPRVGVPQRRSVVRVAHDRVEVVSRMEVGVADRVRRRVHVHGVDVDGTEGVAELMAESLGGMCREDREGRPSFLPGMDHRMGGSIPTAIGRVPLVVDEQEISLGMRSGSFEVAGTRVRVEAHWRELVVVGEADESTLDVVELSDDHGPQGRLATRTCHQRVGVADLDREGVGRRRHRCGGRRGRSRGGSRCRGRCHGGRRGRGRRGRNRGGRRRGSRRGVDDGRGRRGAGIGSSGADARGASGSSDQHADDQDEHLLEVV